MALGHQNKVLEVLAEQITPEEEWRPIPGFVGYSASSNGRIRVDGGHPRNREGILAMPLGHKYLQCMLTPTGKPRHHGNLRPRRVHILVALAFLGPKPTPEHEVNHINGNKLDNRPDNLEYVTSLENEFHAAGWLKARGNNHGARFRKLMVELVDWFDSPIVIACLESRACSPEFSRHAARIWDMAHTLVEGSPEGKKRRAIKIAPTPTFATCQRCQARLYITEGRVFCPNCDSSASKRLSDGTQR